MPYKAIINQKGRINQLLSLFKELSNVFSIIYVFFFIFCLNLGPKQIFPDPDPGNRPVVFPLFIFYVAYRYRLCVKLALAQYGTFFYYTVYEKSFLVTDNRCFTCFISRDR